MPTARKIGRRACDACKIRKIKCSEVPPCVACVTIGTPCTFNKQQGTRGPRSLRPKTIQQIAQAQRRSGSDGRTGQKPGALSELPSPASSTGESTSMDAESGPRTLAQQHHPNHKNVTPIPSLVLRLCVYRLRLFPVWPIIAVEEIMAALHRDVDDLEAYILANAVGAATMAQLKLYQDEASDPVTASSMEAECQRLRLVLHNQPDGPTMNLNTLRTSFFLHVYHENQFAGGAKSLLYLREAITIAQIMRLDKESAYMSLSPAEQQMRRRILWLLFVTERGVAMLHKLPVALKSNVKFPSLDGAGEGEDESHVLPAFKKLVNLFWIFDQSGAFELLQDSDDPGGLAVPLGGMEPASRRCLDVLQRRLREVPLDSEQTSDVQRADICVTRQWMQAVLWKVAANHGQNSSRSLSHPVHIAREFLDFISKLPSTAIEAHGPGMEFKIYEIASAVTEAAANNIRLPRTSTERPRDVLLQLQRILESFRGGNKPLLEMLCAKIAEVQEGPLTVLSRNPSRRVEEVEEVEEEQWPNSLLGITHPPQTSPDGAGDVFPMEEALPTAASHMSPMGLRLSPRSYHQHLMRPSWDSRGYTVQPGELMGQLQTFDGSLNSSMEPMGALDLLIANGALWDAGSGDWAGSPNDHALFNP